MADLTAWERHWLRPPPYPVRAESRPCKACGEPIDPGQSYTPRGPYHCKCKPGARMVRPFPDQRGTA